MFGCAPVNVGFYCVGGGLWLLVLPGQREIRPQQSVAGGDDVCTVSNSRLLIILSSVCCCSQQEHSVFGIFLPQWHVLLGFQEIFTQKAVTSHASP